MQIFTYNDFLKDKEIVTFEQAEIILDELIKSSNIYDPEFQAYWKELIEYSAKYAEMRGKWRILTKEEQDTLDDTRTNIHNRIRDNLISIRGLAQINNKDIPLGSISFITIENVWVILLII